MIERDPGPLSRAARRVGFEPKGARHGAHATLVDQIDLAGSVLLADLLARPRVPPTGRVEAEPVDHRVEVALARVRDRLERARDDLGLLPMFPSARRVAALAERARSDDGEGVRNLVGPLRTSVRAFVDDMQVELGGLREELRRSARLRGGRAAEVADLDEALAGVLRARRAAAEERLLERAFEVLERRVRSALAVEQGPIGHERAALWLVGQGWLKAALEPVLDVVYAGFEHRQIVLCGLVAAITEGER